MSGDLCILTQDPRFGGGALAQLEAFWQGADELGRRPEIAFAQRVSRDDSLDHSPLRGHGAHTRFARVDAIGVPLAARRLERVAREARSLWVVATVAHYGAAAVRAERPYGCWIGTAIRPEWEARRHGLSSTRRIAAAASLPVLRRLERRVLRGATHVYATSRAARSELVDAADLDPEEIRLLPIPVDVVRFRPASEDEWEAARQRPTIVFVGRADDPRKNIELLLAAFESARSDVPGLQLLLVGRPPSGALPAGVVAAGEVADVAAALRRATVMVLPSLQEGFGIVVAEALSCGVPVVTTPCGGPEHLVRESGGGIVLSGFDPDELAEALVGLLADERGLARMRAGGVDYVRQHHSLVRFRELLRSALTELDDAH